MKLRTALLILSLLLCGNLLSAQNQKISIHAESMPIKTFLEKLESASDYTFFYSSTTIENIPDITIDVTDSSINAILDTIFKGTTCGYEIIGHQVALKRNQVKEQAKPKVEAPPVNRTVKGVVLDEHNEPLMGAFVFNEASGQGASTGIDGRFSLSVPFSAKELTVSFLGYESQKLAVQDEMEIMLIPDLRNALDDVVVIGYGTAPKSDLTGSVASVKVQDILDAPVLSVDHALQGRVAGVDIMSTSGDPGAGTSIRVRGTRSITASNEPLIVVDGVADAVSDLTDINADDIESISVLKDASSTAIYGSRGANGVIMVTTKKGTTSKPSVTAKAAFGVSWLARKLDLMNAEEFIRYRNDYIYFLDVSKKNPRYDPASIDRNTDWQDAITRIAPYQNYSISLSGKGKAMKYFSSFSWMDNEGIILNSGIQRFSGRFNFDVDLAKWMSIGFKMSATHSDRNMNKAVISGTGYTNGVVYMSPTIGPWDNQNPLVENSAFINTPVAEASLQDYHRKYLNTNGVMEVTLKPVRKLTIVSQNSAYVSQRHDFRYYPASMPKKAGEEGADASRVENGSMTFSTDNTITWKDRIGRHSYELMTGFSASDIRTNNLSVQAKGLVADGLKWNNLNGIASKENYTVTSSYVHIVRESVFGRANYDYRKKYFFTATFRSDASSSFAAKRKWGFFPSAAFRWNIKKESFMRNLSWVDDLSLRASVGRTGNDAISPYNSMQAYTSTTASYLFDGTQGVSYYPGRLDNPDLTWETTDQANLALSGSLFKERVQVEMELYASRTKDILLSVAVPQVTGYDTRLQNLGLTTNRGLEFSLETHNIERPRFGWTTNFTVSHNSQMVKDIGNENYVPVINSPGSLKYMMYGYKAGYPLNALWGFRYRGVVHNAEEYNDNIDSHEFAYRTTVSSASNALGLPRYEDVNHDGILDQNDIVYLGNADPIVYGGLQNTFHMGPVRLSVYFTYSIGGSIYNYSELYMAGSYTTNQYRYMLDSWHPGRNPDSDIPRAGTNNVLLPSSFMVHDASFVRLKTLSVQYTFSFKKSWIRNFTLGLSGDNLWLWTPYNGYDPDVSTQSEDSALRRVDLNAYPNSSKVVLNLQIKF